MKRKGFNPIIEVVDDGLFIGEPVGIWAEEKYNLLGLYCDIFTKSMRKKWDNLVYIDLFSGSGYSIIENNKKILKSSSLIAMSVPQKFNKYIICEQNKKLCNSLAQRVAAQYGQLNVTVIEGDCNIVIDKIISEIPSGSLCFCFADPFNLKDLKFRTITKLGEHLRMDFLILIATGMDAKRNIDIHYKAPSNTVVENFLNDKDWREKFAKSGLTFVQFLANAYDTKMQTMGYKQAPAFQQIKMSYKNVPLYHLAFYSKNDLGNKFWDEVKKYKNVQRELF